MNFISIDFFFYLGISFLLYYLLPIKFRWIILLLSSVIFYLQGGRKILFYTVALSFVAYILAIMIEKANDKKKSLLVSLGIVFFFVILSTFKIASYLNISNYYFIVPIGLSYYTLSIMSYLLDVYWEKDKAERNFLRFLTFVLYFPKILQGPISRHSFTGESITMGHRFEYRSVCFGSQLILWGLFKKIVIADRLNIFVSMIYGNMEMYKNSGAILFMTMIMSSVQLYCDFSGYTDMAIGISQLFGIELEQNFRRPFFSRSASEFWQRWHMTLSGWFKDYLFLPVSRNKIVKKISKKMGSRFGAMSRKKTMIVISTSVVWLATALWHGTGINYLVWGGYWGSIIIFSELFSDWIEKFSRLLRINTVAPTWKLWQMMRTFMIFTVGRMISSQKDLHSVKLIARALVKEFHASGLLHVTSIGLSQYDFTILIGAVFLLLAVSVFQEKGFCIREEVAKWNAIPRWLLYSVEIVTILLFGIYGAGYDMSTFAYQFF